MFLDSLASVFQTSLLFTCRSTLCLLGYKERYNKTAKAFKWRFTQAELKRLAEVA